MPIPIYQVDAFTDRHFAGNPAAVCLLKEPRDATWMQNVASEMNLSETAFIVSREDGYDLRWFTPAVEVDLCGHATLASAHVLWEEADLPDDCEACFHTRSGVLTARRDDGWIELDLPAYAAEPVTPPADVLAGLGAEPVAVSLARGGHNHVVEMACEEVVRELKPDFSRFRRLSTGVIATSRGDDPEVDFVSRYFAGTFGIDEDPVTGSAHCVLGPYWQDRLGKSEFLARQISTRGGTLKVRVAGDRALIAGKAVTVLVGEIRDSHLFSVHRSCRRREPSAENR